VHGLDSFKNNQLLSDFPEFRQGAQPELPRFWPFHRSSQKPAAAIT
jgi:hypothetical protein